MKKTHVMLLFTLAVLSILLTACAGGAVAESWPGVSVNSDMVYLSYASHIYEIGLSNGVEKWRYPAEPENKLSFYAPAALSEDGQILAGSYNHVFYSIAQGGAQANWSFTESKDRYIGKALVLGDQVFAGSADGNLYVMGLNGNPRWQYATGHAIWGTPVSDGKAVYVASMDHHIYAFNPRSGELIWKTEDLGGQIVATPALSDSGVLYVGTFGSRTDNTEKSSRMVAVSSSNGQILWSAPIRGWVWATPMLKNDVMYFGDSEGYIYALDTDGKEIWSRQLDTSPNRAIIGEPALLEDRLYFGSKAGLLYIVNLSDGQPAIASPVQIGGQIQAGLVAVDDKILIAPTGLESALLMAVNPDGITQWSFVPQKK